MLRIVLLSFFAFTPLAPACSAPQFDATRSARAETLDELIDHGHFRRALNQLSAQTPAKDASPAQRARHDYLLSRIELGFGQLDDAMQLAERAIAAQPQNAAYHVQAAAVAGVTAEHASMFKQLSLAKRAKKELDEAAALDPANADAMDGLMLYDQNAPAFIGGDKAKAQKFAEQITALDAPRGWVAQAALAHERKDTAAEEAMLNKAVAADPDHYEAQIALATFLKRADPPRVDEAEEHACLALRLDSGRTDAWQLLASLAALEGCALEVDGLIRTAAKFNPDDASPAYSAAVEYVELGENLDQAQTLLQSYLDKPQEGDRPTAGRARYELGLAFEKKGRTGQAAFLIRLALREDPTLDDARKDLKRLERAQSETAQ